MPFFLLQRVLSKLQGAPATAHQNVWITHDGTPAHLRLRRVITFMLHIPEGELEAKELLLCLLTPRNLCGLIHLKSLIYETPVATVEDLTARFVVVYANIASTWNLFERVVTFPASQL
ncbi:hypothetical protein TNCV_1618051 [Trichonephila clavipes]|nr:hypothetical protein TNCV_1618051 [Trichonephila clavipes]